MSSHPNPYEPTAEITIHEPPGPNDEGESQPAAVEIPHGWGLAASLGIALSSFIAVSNLLLQFRLLALYGARSDEFDLALEDWILDSMNKLHFFETLIWVPTSLVFIVWMYRAHRNLPGLGHPKLNSYPVWVVLCWLIPIMSWFAPYQVMREIWDRSQPNPAPGRTAASRAIVQWWWGLWLIFQASSFAGSYLDQRVQSVPQAAMAARCDIVTLMTMIASGVLAILIIYRINRSQLERFRQMY
jgi:hypothetical protein